MKTNRIQQNRKTVRISVNKSHLLLFKRRNKQKTKKKTIINYNHLIKILKTCLQQRKKSSKSSSFLKKNSKRFCILILELIIHLKLINLMKQTSLNRKGANKKLTLQQHNKEMNLLEQNNLQFLLMQFLIKSKINKFLLQLVQNKLRKTIKIINKIRKEVVT